MSSPIRVEYGHYADQYTWARFDAKRHRVLVPEFGSHETFYQSLRRMTLEGVVKNGPMSATLAPNDLVAFNQAGDELEWHLSGKPYYKIDPRLLPYLLNLNANIPAEHFCVPFESFEIRLPKEGLQEGVGTPWIRAVLVTRYKEQDLKEAKDTLQLPILESPRADMFIARLSLGNEPVEYFVPSMGMVKEEAPAQMFVRFDLTPGKGMIDCLRDRPKDMPNMQGYVPGNDFIESVIKVAVAVSLMASHNEEMLTPDIPRKLVDRYRRAKTTGDKAILDSIENKRLKLGMGKGWVIGMEDWERPVIVPGHGEVRGSLKFGHWRSAHPRLQPTGPKTKPIYRLILLAPARVRKDLPLKPTHS
jgi:hypothetical protein